MKKRENCDAVDNLSASSILISYDDMGFGKKRSRITTFTDSSCAIEILYILFESKKVELQFQI